jgi:AcrR family transcriptional regulator
LNHHKQNKSQENFQDTKSFLSIAQTKSIMETKGNILKGVDGLFMRFGLKSITMDDIASKLSMSKKTIYQYFKDKDSLVSEFVKGFLDQQKIELLKIRKESKDVIEELVKTSEYLKTKVCNVNPVVLLDLRKYHPAAWKIFQDHKKEFIQNHISETLRNGMFDGYFRKNMNVKIISRMRIEQIEQGYNPDIFPVEEFPSSDVQIQLFDHFVYGICTLKGHQLLNQYHKIED